MFKRLASLGLVIIAITTSLIACNKEQVVIESKERIVTTTRLDESEMVERVSYIGHIEPREIKNYALKTSGLIEEIHIESGQAIESGDILVTLDDYEYNLSLEASSDQVSLAQLDVSKAKEALNYIEKNYKDMKVLFENGIASQAQMDELELQRDIKQKEYNQAINVLSQANVDSKYKESTLEDTSLYADIDGYVVDVLNEPGELIAEGYPLVIVRSKDNVVKIGMTAEDVKQIDINTRAKVVVDDKEYDALVSNINMMPDMKSKTFEVALTIDHGNFFIGESAKVYFEMQMIKGVWVDISYILNDGVDYVYLEKDNRATRVDVQLAELNESMVRVENLEPGSNLIISGTNVLAEGYKVKSVGDHNE
ncbi:efflux RND transporter periplasmic adaptor subunit [Acidaminobacter sp. JC074]|uniref:efflux RND transporter periplasmic adaptor subunit n=1 Tax=Acidaminobacter sp. JC074 TaxID=2530199 RepID=UPI001F0E7557|nr:efflux RND transporter periplasmic adaptor subunit [Acidaminobacter sp. JC074]MCH4886200.1 efflux RND transporter periplasmic adaptor subunit [Acidaminobacter sp. JC074]